jgi:hypothetical protein
VGAQAGEGGGLDQAPVATGWGGCAELFSLGASSGGGHGSLCTHRQFAWRDFRCSAQRANEASCAVRLSRALVLSRRSRFTSKLPSPSIPASKRISTVPRIAEPRRRASCPASRSSTKRRLPDDRSASRIAASSPLWSSAGVTSCGPRRGDADPMRRMLDPMSNSSRGTLMPQFDAYFKRNRQTMKQTRDPFFLAEENQIAQRTGVRDDHTERSTFALASRSSNLANSSL